MKIHAVCFSVLLFPLFCAGLVSAQTSVPVKPYEPKGENDLMTLGAAKAARFEAPKTLTWPAAEGEAEICLWKDDKFAAWSITIDDNCAPDHEWWLQKAQQYGLRLTWFLITDRIGGRNAGFDGTWEKYQKLVNAGHAVESHTSNHKVPKDLTPEELEACYAESIAAIEAGLPGYKVTCVAYPRGSGDTALAGRYFIAARGTVGTPNVVSKINYLNTNSGGIGKDFITAVLEGKAEKVKWLGKPMYLRGWVAPLFHLVAHGKTPEAKAASIAEAEKQLEVLGAFKDVLWFGTFPEVAKYGQERDSATLSVTAKGSGYAITVTDKMRDDLFAFPLTVKLRVPDSWNAVRAVQGGRDVSARIITHDGAKYVLADAIPDRGAVLVQPSL